MEEIPALERVAKIQKRQCEVPGVRWRASRIGVCVEAHGH